MGGRSWSRWGHLQPHDTYIFVSKKNTIVIKERFFDKTKEDLYRYLLIGSNLNSITQLINQ